MTTRDNSKSRDDTAGKMTIVAGNRDNRRVVWLIIDHRERRRRYTVTKKKSSPHDSRRICEDRDNNIKLLRSCYHASRVGLLAPKRARRGRAKGHGRERLRDCDETNCVDSAYLLTTQEFGHYPDSYKPWYSWDDNKTNKQCRIVRRAERTIRRIRRLVLNSAMAKIISDDVVLTYFRYDINIVLIF